LDLGAKGRWADDAHVATTSSWKASHVTCQFISQYRGPDGSLERAPRRIAIFGWLVFVIAAIAIGTAVGQMTIDQHAYTAGEAHRGEQILKQAGFAQAGRLTEIVAIQSKSLTVADPAFRATVRLSGHEGDILRRVLPWSIGLVLAMGVLMLLQSGILSFMVP